MAQIFETIAELEPDDAAESDRSAAVPNNSMVGHIFVGVTWLWRRRGRRTRLNEHPPPPRLIKKYTSTVPQFYRDP